jgi:hypothetical protein
MAKIHQMTHNNFVRFFSDYVICDHCGEETRGRCYAETQQVVCSKCKGVLLEVDENMNDDPTDGMMIVTYIPGDFDGQSE